MQKEPQIASFEGGALRILDSSVKSREVVLALPLNRLLVKMVRVKPDEDPTTVSTPILKALNPFPDDPLFVSCEQVYASESEALYLSAALPESSADDIAEALDVAKLNVVRIDALVLGQLRTLWPRLHIVPDERRLVRIKSADCISLIVLDGDRPSSIRAVDPSADLKREELLSLLEAEDFGGPKPIAETLEFDAAELDLSGVAERAQSPDSLDVLPESWRTVLEETRFKAKLIKNLAIAGGIWLVILGVLFGVPVGYGFMTDSVKADSKAHSRAYKEVADKKAKVKLVQQYSDRTRGALEILKSVSDRLPEAPAITLLSWDFKRDEGVRLRGEADTTSSVYAFKDRLVEMGDDDPVFKVVNLGSLNAQKNQQRFELECRYEEEEEAQ